jgi:CBS domain-containing protein
MTSKNGRQPADGELRRRAMLGMLREARAIVHRDAESFNEAATVLEHVGQMLRGTVLNGLNDYRGVILALAQKAPDFQRECVESLFDTVRQARNDSVHSGDYIRHHATRLVELLLVLEEGLAMTAKVVSDLMVQNPTMAELWHNIAAVRRAMLTNSFSFLPVRDANGVWKLLADIAVVRYLKRADKAKERSALLGKPLKDALEEKSIELTECVRISPSKSVHDVAKTMNHTPMLVIEQDGTKERLIGILTAFDLL